MRIISNGNSNCTDSCDCVGSIGLISGRMGGTARQQTLGMTMGALVFGLALWAVEQPTLTSKIWLIGIVSGYSGVLVKVNNLRQ